MLPRLLTRAFLPAVAALTVAAAPAAAVEPGVNMGPRTHGSTIDHNAEAAATGSRWVRLFADWPVIQPTNGPLDPVAVSGLKSAVDGAHAKGLKVDVVVSRSPKWASGSDSVIAPPADPAAYAAFMGKLVTALGGSVEAWEIWNEPDDDVHWLNGPQPAAYAALLKATYPAIKAADPDATVVTGGMVGNDYGFLDQLYANGVKGSFDAVGVHTDTACNTTNPEEYYREPSGRIGRWSFTGYREVRQSMLNNGEDKPVWMTELGWSTTPAICSVGERAGTKAGGVSEAEQADFLKRAFACLQGDGIVKVAMWFSLQDVDTATQYDHRLGLIGDSGARKPAFSAFQSWAAAPFGNTSCGGVVDTGAPVVTLQTPVDDEQYLDILSIRATAKDDIGVRRMDFAVDGQKVPGSQESSTFAIDWHGAKNLSYGRHTITVRAYDEASNVGTASVVVIKDKAGNIKVPDALLAFKAKHLGGRKVQLKGGITQPAGTKIEPKGKVRMAFQIKRGKRWTTWSKYTKSAGAPFNFKIKLRFKGTWRVRAEFLAEKPYKPLRTSYTVIKAR